ncbi:MAG TPA: response regulator [Candidatus Binatia bacterium]|nr:response regulator [Candidatus Binatia bacterium]
MKEVLLVEDNPADVYLIRRVVEDCGRDIHLFVEPDGGEALAFLRKDAPFTHVPSPTLILLDLTLPKVRGDQILPEIRQLPAYQTTPIVVLSAAPKEEIEQRCLQCGATAYVQKSANFYAYVDAIKAIVNAWLKSESAHSK